MTLSLVAQSMPSRMFIAQRASGAHQFAPCVVAKATHGSSAPKLVLASPDSWTMPHVPPVSMMYMP